MVLNIRFKILVCSVLCLFGGILASCGVYSFSGSTLPGHIKTVAVPLFENTTPEFGVDQSITDALIESISQDNTLKIASERNADSIIRGKITRLIDTADAYDREENVSGSRVTITVEVIFEDVKKRKELWKETWSHWGRYGSDDLTFQDAIKEVANKLTNDILNRTVSGW